MLTRRRVFYTFILIVLIAFGAGFLDFPDSRTIRVGSWEYTVRLHLGLDLQGGTHLVYSADVSDIPASDRDDALEGVRDVIERRVNALGVAEPIIQSQVVGDDYRVIADLAGITDITEAINLIGETPTLDFRERDPSAKGSPPAADRDAIRTRAEEVLARALSGEDFSALANEFTDDPGNVGPDGSTAGGSLGFAARGTYVPEFETVLFDKLSDGEIYPELVETQFGFHIIKRLASKEVVENGETSEQVQGQHILFSTQPQQLALSDFVRTGLSGKQLERAQVSFDPNTGAPEVQLTFNSEGAALFKDITERNVGNLVGIFLDDFPISTPSVNQVITDGNAVITGNFTLKEAKQLAQRLNAGALPVPITLLTQQNVGASLGQVSVQKSMVAGIIGLLAVILFMVLYYRLPGLLAVFALVVYTLITFAIFKLLSVTLTLAGIAGFILSIGIAVDANILIFERLKEELRSGQEIGVAIEEGFRRAWSSIRDSNISSLITTLILIWFGTSLIKGFAITLSIGILVSMFSAITVTRTFMRLVLTRDGKAARWLLGVTGTGDHV